VTQLEDPNLRYSKLQLGTDECTPVARLPRIEALAQERWYVEQEPGPMNFEPWAGKPSVWSIEDEGPYLPASAGENLTESPSQLSPSCDCQTEAAMEVSAAEAGAEVAAEQEMEQSIFERFFP
jgi:hypothetical protein